MKWIPIALIGMLLAGCTAAPPKLSIDPAEATLDGTTTWTVRLKLETDLTYMHPGCSPDTFTLEVDTPNGTVPLYAYGVEPLAGPCVVKEVTLKAGTHSAAYQWNGRIDPAAPSAHGGDLVDPGTYQLTARLRGTAYLAFGNVTVS